MNAIPNIIVQLIHIEGPLKGEIQELSDPEIVIGRHPDCQVQFPKEVVTLSRRHARIVREGNRFKLVDQSTNGTFLNGKQVPEAYLKDGDVIMFSEGGPKISFLTQVSDQPASPIEPPPIASPAPQPYPAASQPVSAHPTPPPIQSTPAAPAPSELPPAAPVQPSPPAHPAAAAPVIQTIKIPFAIQYGPALKSFQTLPITIGKGANNDFVIDHPAINAQQVQFFFAQDQYWIKDLTGTNSVTLNGMPISGQAALQPEMQIALSPQGPRFRFLGGGRLAEVEEAPPAMPEPSPQPDPTPPTEESTPGAGRQKSGSLFKKFFS